ncbi:tandem-95 repeat protein [Vibrio ulleungensis]|uniref:tandem-95 repeat protein n=1 Tax=Vibrio ulleungensis TaxID=2807619 RepID=UPI002E294926|nr:tandem-95 repeat protein [Vibrio ulleungensis]
MSTTPVLANPSQGSINTDTDGNFVFTPAENFYGDVVVNWTTEDDDGATATTTSTITVGDVNDGPAITADDKTTDEDVAVVLTFDASDVDGTIVSTTPALANPSQGSISTDSDGNFVFTPAENFYGDVVINWTTEDDDGATATTTSTITVGDVNDGPAITADNKTTDEDVAVVLTFDASDVDGTIVSTTPTLADATQGSISTDSDGNFVFTPAENFYGDVVINWTTEDDDGATATTTSTITVTDVNDGPTITADNKTTDEDVAVVLTFDASDVDGTIVSTTPVLANPSQGSISTDSDGNFVFTPAENFYGDVVVNWTTEDNDGATTTTTSIINVGEVNDGPIAVNDLATTNEDTAVIINVLDNDTDIDGDELSVVSATSPNGSVVINGDGTITFTPNKDFNGEATINYVISDGNGGTSNADVSVTVTPDNADTILNDDSISVTEDSNAVGNVLTNDVEDDSPLTVVEFTIDGVTGSFNAGDTVVLSGGEFTLNQDGSYVFESNENWHGQVPTVTYTTNTGDTADLSIEVTPVDDPSKLVKDSITVDEDTVANGNVLANDSDVDSSLLVATFQINGQTYNAGQSVTIPGIGDFTLSSNGDYTFTPIADWNGNTPDIIYTTNTGQSEGLSIEVLPVNDAPDANDDNYLVNSGSSVSLDLTANDTDIDGDDVVLVSIDGVALTGGAQVITLGDGSGVVNIDNNGNIEFVPADGYEGDATFEYVISDGDLQSTGNATIEVNTVDAENDGDNDAIYQVNADFTSGVVIPVDGNGQPLFSIEAITYDSNGNAVTGSISVLDGYGIGVANSIRDTGQVPDQIEFDPDTGRSEQLKIEFSELVNQVDFGAERLFGDENGGEQGAWSAYYNGELVASGTFENPAGSTSGDFTIDTGDIVFDTLVFEANENSVLTGDSSDYVISSINASGVDLGDGAIVASEDSGITISDPAQGLLANDSDSQGDSFGITHVNGQQVTNGQVIALASGALLTIYADGTYGYDSNGAFEYLSAGELVKDSFTYTITDEHGATDTATATVNVIGNNDVPVGSEDSAAMEEGAVLVFNPDQLVANDSDVDGDSLQLVTLATDASGSGQVDISSPGATFTTALGGTVVVNEDGTFSYQAPSGLDHSDSATLVDSIYYQVTDGNGNSTWTEVEIDISDSVPVAIDDSDSVGFGGVGYGNLIEGENNGSGKDELGNDATEVTSITYENVTYDSWDENGELTITTDNAVVTFNQDGSYRYESTQSEGQVESFSAIDMLSNQGITLYAYSDYTQVDVNNLNGDSASVVSNGGNVGIYYNNNAGNGDQIRYDEALVTKFSEEAHVANFTLDGVQNSETVYWQAYDAQGNLVDSGSVNSNDLTIATNTGFTSVVLYTGSTNNFTVDSVDVQYGVGSSIEDSFQYELTDADGSTSSAELTVTQDSLPDAKDNVADVYEAGLDSGSETGTGSNIVSGNLLDNDGGISDSTVITEVGNQTPVNGVITVDTVYGTLTVYVDDSNGRRAGDFDYELTETSSGDDVVDSVEYVIENGVGVTDSAQLDIKIVDDVPMVSDIERNLTTDADPVTTNLTFVLDLSGSMDYAAGNGKTYLETAIESLRALVNEVDDTGNVNVQVVTFSGSDIENSGWLIDDIDETINYLESLEASGGTLYHDALQEVMTSGALPAADQSFVYFISDGVPNSGSEITDARQTDWEDYLDTANYDIAFAIGIGNAPLDELTPIAHSVDPNDDDSEYAVIVDDADDLTDTVLEYFDNGTITGEVKLLDTEGGILEGADGVSITAVTIDGVTYQYDALTPEITVQTVMGGEFRINFESGEYYYGIEVDRNVLNEKEVIEIQIEDGDGDQDSLDLTLNIDYYAAIDANVNNIITNAAEGTTLNVDSDYLLHGDATSSDTTFTDITSDDVSVSNTDGQITIENGSSGDVLEYLIEGNGTSDSARVELDYQDSSQLIGTNANDIIIAQSTASSGVPIMLNATVRSGSTFSTANQFGFTFATIAAGLSITELNIDLSSIDNDGYWDVSENIQFNSSNSVGIDESSNIWDEMNSDSAILTANFAEGDFTSGDEFWFSFDTDSFGNNQGSSFVGVSFNITLSDGSALQGTFVSDGANGATAVISQGIDSYLDGAAGDDVLVGGDGSDLLIGGEGDDLLIGGKGNDILTGGEGSDLFAWHEGDLDGSTDTITDFDLAFDVQGDYQGEKVDLSDLFHDVESDDVGALLDTIAQTVSTTDNGSSITVDRLGDKVTIEFDGVSSTDLTNNLANMLIIKDDI